MKNTQNIGAKLERQLISAFAMLDAWFDCADIHSSHIRDVLESIVSQNQQLLRQMSDEAIGERAYTSEDAAYGLLTPPRDCAVGDVSDVYNVSRCNRRQHDEAGMEKLRRELRKQLEFCLEQLDTLRHGEATSDHRIAAVESIMNLDIYQYIRCVMQITRRGYEGISEAGGVKP